MASSATTLLFHHGSTRLIARTRCQSPLLRTCGVKPFLSFRSSRGGSGAPLGIPLKAKSVGLARAYVTGAPPIVGEEDPKIDGSKSEPEKEESKDLIKWGLVWSLMSKHKLRLVVCLLTLVGCSTCTLSMPVFSGNWLLRFSLTLIYCDCLFLMIRRFWVTISRRSPNQFSWRTDRFRWNWTYDHLDP